MSDVTFGQAFLATIPASILTLAAVYFADRYGWNVDRGSSVFALWFAQVYAYAFLLNLRSRRARASRTLEDS